MNSVGQRDPPPYPGQGQSWASLQGVQQSYSGSDPNTDISLSSTESLTGARQEPQGQETTSHASTPRDSLTSSPFLLSNPDTSDFKSECSESAAYYMTSPLAMPALAGTEHLIGGGRSSRPGSQPSSRPSSRAGSRAGSHVGSRGASPMKDEQRQAIVTTCRAVLPYNNPPSNAELQNQILQPIMKPVPSSPPVTGNNTKLAVPGVSPSSSQASPQASFRIKANSPNSEMVNQLQMLILQSQLQHQQNPQQGDPQQTQQHQHRAEAQQQRGELQQMQQQAQIQLQQRGESHQIQQLLQQQLAERQQQLHQQRVETQQVQQPQRIPQQQIHQQQSQPTSRPRPSSAGSTPIQYHQGQGYIHTQGHGQGQQITVGMSGNGAVENIHYSHSLRSCKSMSPTPVHMLRQEAVPRPATAPAADTHSLPQYSARSLRRSYEMLDRLTQHQPDLSRLAGDLHTSQVLLHAQQPTVVHVNNTPVPSQKKLPDLDHAAIATRATQMVERLSQENLSLRKELETYYNKVCKLQKFEGEIKKVHEAYEALVKHSQKRESLEKAMRSKLEAHVNTLNLNTHQLKEQLDKAMRRLATEQLCEGGDSAGTDLIDQLHKKDAEMNKLIVRNRDLVVTGERLKAKVEAQRKTLQEQQAQINILDTALSHTQTHSLKYEEELSRRRVEEDRVSSLKQVLTQMQSVSEKRQSVDTQMIGNLRQEVTRLRQQMEGLGSVEREESQEELTDLLQQLRQKDEHILQLQAQVLAWKQKLIEETSLRQIKSENDSPTKESRLDLQGTEVMGEGHGDKLKHLEEVYLANRRAAEAEARLGALHTQLAEKEAMLRVLQRHPMLGRTANISTLLSSIHHSGIQSIAPCVSPISTSPLPSTPHSNYSNPPSSASSRQNSQLDSCTLLSMNSRGSPTTGNSHLETTMAVHSKSSSIGSTTTAASSTSSTNSINGESHLRDLHLQMSARAAMLGGLDSGAEQLKKQFWQV